MPTIPEQYVKMRAELLAKVFLTRQPAFLTELGEDDDLHFLVRLMPEKDEYHTVPIFGVMLQVTVKEIEGEKQAENLANTNWAKMTKLGHLMPVLYLVFSLHNDEGFLAWAQEPCVGHEVPKILRHKSLQFKKVNSKTYDSVVSQIRTWSKDLSNLVFVEG